LKVGDLVRIAPHCKNRGELVIVTDVPPWKGEVKIRYLNKTEATAGEHMAYTNNLILLSGKHESR